MNTKLPLPKEFLYQEFQRAAHWVLARISSGGAAYTADAQPTLMAGAFALLALESLGQLNQKPISDVVANLAKFIHDSQDEETGFFSPESVRREDCAWRSNCTPTYIRYQLTYFCTSALESVALVPKHRLRFVQPFLNSQYTLGWLDGGAWDNPWNQSNQVMFLLHFLRLFAYTEKEDRAMEVFDKVLDYLLDRQSRKTGLWHGTSNATTAEAVFAAYHFLPFFFWRGRAIPYQDKIIDSVLEIQHEDGLFGSYPGGGACEDVDAIDVLATISRLTDYREGDVRNCMERALKALLDLQNSDGGFPDHQIAPGEQLRTWRRKVLDLSGLSQVLKRPLPVPKEYYSSWYLFGSYKGSSTLWGTWFRPLAINIICSRFPCFVSEPYNSVFHAVPCLGWHDVNAIMAAK